MTSHPGWHHVYPVFHDPPHDTNGTSCWCGPCYSIPCSQCDFGDDPGCWKCGGEGWVDVGEDEAIEIPKLVIIHHDTRE